MIIASVAISHAELAYHILDILMHSPGRDIFQAFSIGRHWKILGKIVPIALLNDEHNDVCADTENAGGEDPKIQTEHRHLRKAEG